MNKAEKYLKERDLYEFHEQVNGKDAEVTGDTIQAMIDNYCDEKSGDLYEHRKDVVSAYEQHFDMGYDLGYAKGLAE